jgi:hypothetical protein
LSAVFALLGLLLVALWVREADAGARQGG